LPVHKVLDFPCGYGRVLRMLKAQFAEAEIFASELNPTALAFCESAFAVKNFASTVDFKQIEKTGQFDLIWCGSLITHIDESSVTDLLRFFYENLAPGGLCVFSTHGLKSLDALQAGVFSYNLSASAQENALAGYRSNGFGFGNYRFREGYGVSLSSREKIEAMAASVGDWSEVMFKSSGWDEHQDVFAFCKMS
jgi:SAM-dependent methyltransferase